MSARSKAIDAYLLFGRLAVKYQHLTPEQLKKAIAQHAKAAKAGESSRLGEICVRLKMLTPEQCEQIVDKQAEAEIKSEGSYFGYLSLVNGFVNKEQLTSVLKKQKKIKKQGEEPPRLGELFVTNGLMTEGQVEAILSAQMRLRDRLATESGTQADITMSGRIPVMGDRAQEALKRLAEYEASLGTELEIEITSDDALPQGGVDLPPPPAEFTRTVSTDDIEVHFGASSEQLFNSGASEAEPAAAPVPPADVEAEEEGQPLPSSGLQLDDAEAIEIEPVGGSSVPPPPPPPPKPATPASDVPEPLDPAAALELMSSGSKEKDPLEPATSSSQAAASDSAEANLFAQASEPASPTAAPASPAVGAPTAKAEKESPAAAAAAEKAKHFRGRRSQAPGDSAEFTPPPSGNRMVLFIILGAAAAIAGAYTLTILLLG